LLCQLKVEIQLKGNELSEAETKTRFSWQFVNFLVQNFFPFMMCIEAITANCYISSRHKQPEGIAIKFSLLLHAPRRLMFTSDSKNLSPPSFFPAVSSRVARGKIEENK
jgi:hypothetical protein